MTGAFAAIKVKQYLPVDFRESVLYLLPVERRTVVSHPVHRALLIGARVITGSLFGVSSLAKLFSPDAAAAMMVQLLSVSSPTAYLLTYGFCLIELAIAIRLLLFRLSFFASALSSTILLGSTLLGVLLLENPIECGCFGSLMETKTDEFFLGRNVGFLFVSIFLLHKSVQHGRVTPDGQNHSSAV